jgi:hypothetical protein
VQVLRAASSGAARPFINRFFTDFFQPIFSSGICD